MRITCTTIDAFIANLEGNGVFNRTVYVSESLHSMNAGKPVREATSVMVVFQASAVVEFESDGEALLECGIECGVNRLTADGNTEGSEEKDRIRSQLEDYCKARDLQIKPGLLQL